MALWNRQSRVAWLKSTLKNRIVILDGGMGTMICLLYTSPSPRDLSTSRMPSSA